jgi:hypothetical protein
MYRYTNPPRNGVDDVLDPASVPTWVDPRTLAKPVVRG